MIRIGSPALDWALGTLSFVLWTGAYLIYFARDIRVSFWRYRHRHELAMIRRAHGHSVASRYTVAPRHRPWHPPDLRADLAGDTRRTPKSAGSTTIIDVDYEEAETQPEYDDSHAPLRPGQRPGAAADQITT